MQQFLIKTGMVRQKLCAAISNKSAFAIGIFLMWMIAASTSLAQSNITYAEYYLDNDPGFNLATPISITAGTNVQNVAVNLDMTAIKSGAHFFGTRARTAAGVWSMNHYWIFFKPYDVVLSPAPLTNISRVEYYVDTDPGIGNATSVAVTPGTNLADLTFSVNPLQLVQGMHIIGSRAVTVNGLWSKTNYWLFYKPYGNLAPGVAANINYAEYFVDTDPGIGQATSVSITPAINLSDINFPVDLTNRASGSHIIGARAKDAAGKWSMTNYWLFVKPYANIVANALPNVTAVEYYLDYDPGTGNGTAIPVAAATNLADLTFNVDLTNVVGGTHFVSVRAKDANGKWSFVNSYEFTKPGTAPALTTIVSGTTYCAGATVNVGYQLSSPVTFNANNKFVAQLSDVNGSFLNPKEIGSINTTNESGSFSCTVPANAAQSSSYRIRVITTNQTIIGTNNGTNITVYALPPVPSITKPLADTTICLGNQLQLTSGATSYTVQWLLNDQPIPGATSYSYTVPNIATANAGAYRLRLTNASTCHVYSPVINITVNPDVPAVPTVSPSGNIGVCLGNIRTLSSSASANNQWYKDGNLVPGATGQTIDVSAAGTYTVRVSNNTGCVSSSATSAVVTVGVAAQQPTVTAGGPTTFCQNQSVTFTSSSFSNNQWLRNGVPVSGATSQTYSATQSGFYKVMVSGGGCDVISDSIQVTVNPNVTPSVSLAASGNNVPEGTSITFTATPVNGGNAPQFVFKVNNTVVQTSSSNTYTTSALTNGSVVNCTLTSNAVCATSATATSNNVTLTLAVPIAISGRISHPLGLIIPSPTVRLSVGLTDSTVADATGRFSFNLFQQRNYNISPRKNNDEIKAKGVNVLDVIQVQNHILGSTLLNSPYKIIAADVNGDNAVNIFDVLGIKRLILGMDTTFAGSRLWAFVDSAQTFSNPVNPFPYNNSKSYNNLTASQINQSFFGMKLGDVTFDWAPTAGQNRETNTLKPVQLYYDTVYAEKGDAVRLKIRVRNFSDLVGMQFTLGFNTSSFRFVGIENKQLPVEHNANYADKGALTFVWADAGSIPKTLADGSVLFDVLLIKNRDISKEDIIIETGYTPSVAYNKGYEAASVEKGEGVILQKSIAAITGVFTDKLDVNPNPSSGLIKVSISSPEAKNIVLIVTDEHGRVIMQNPVDVNAGVNQFQLNIKEKINVAAGIYYLNAKGLNVAAKKLLITNR